MITWGAFLLLIFALLAVDLGVFNRNPHRISAKEALAWTSVWIATSLVFSVGIYFAYETNFEDLGTKSGLGGKVAAVEFLTAYVIEKALSLDNIFVMAVIFTHMKIPDEQQHRVLYWGILGALLMRGAMILGGLALIERFSWLIYVFGGILLVSALKMLKGGDDDDPNVGESSVLRWTRKVLPVTPQLHGQAFFIRVEGKRMVTPLLLTLILIETTDVIFALDSVPAVFSVTTDPYLVFTSNVLAILGLRSLYFALAAIIGKFKYLKPALVLVLLFVSIKMLGSDFFHIPPTISLAVILTLLGGGVIVSWAKVRP